jgi:hypothetical protein
MRRFSLFSIAATTIIVATMMLWPGDAPWGGDDRLLVRAAVAANAGHQLDRVGLTGSYGQPYGPVPVQIYQALLWITHDLRTLVRLHAALFAGVTAAALFWLGRSLRISPWLVPAVMTGPYFWFYGRLLWDNSFAIPVGALLLAGYASMCTRPGRWNVLVTAGSAAALPMIHLMNVPLVTAVAVHSLLTRGRVWVRGWKELAVVAIVAGISCGSYVRLMFDRLAHPAPGTTAITPPAERESIRSAALFPLLGARLFEGYHFFDERGPESGIETTPFVTAARFATLAVYPLVWLGIATAVFQSFKGLSAILSSFWTGRRLNRDTVLRTVPATVMRSETPAGLNRGHGPEDRVTTSAQTPHRPDHTEVAAAISAVIVLTLILQSAMDALTGLRPFPHYHGATWAVTAVCFWFGTKTLAALPWSNRAGRVAAVLTAAVITAMAAVCTAGFAIDIHRHAGGTRWHGPTMNAQRVSRADDAR